MGWLELLLSLLSSGALPLLFFWANCGCCFSCTLLSDDFGTTLDKWDVIAGTWSVVGGGSGILHPSAASGIILAEDSSGNDIVTGDDGARMAIAPSANTGDLWWFIFGWTDSSNYSYVMFKVKTPSLGVSDIYIAGYRVTGGVTSWLPIQRTSGVYATDVDTGDLCYALRTGGPVSVTMCWDATDCVVSTATGSVKFTGHSYAGRLGIGCGPGSPHPSMGIDSVVISRNRTEAPDCDDCATCFDLCGGNLAETIEVEFAADALQESTNTGAVSSTCCSLINGQTFVLEPMAWGPNACAPGGDYVALNNNNSVCWYGYDLPGTCTSIWDSPDDISPSSTITWTVSIRAEFRNQLYIYLIFTIQSSTGFGSPGCVQQFCLQGGPGASCASFSAAMAHVNCALPLSALHELDMVCTSDCGLCTDETAESGRISCLRPCEPDNFIATALA